MRQVGHLVKLYYEVPTANLGRTGFAWLSSAPPAKYRDVIKYPFHKPANPLIIELSDDTQPGVTANQNNY